MSATVVALFGAALFELRTPEPDRATLAGVLSLLARAGEGAPQLFELADSQLMVNGVAVSLTAPGAAVIADALVDHDTGKLQLPAEMGPTHWREVVEVYAAPFAHFPTAQHVQAALRIVIPAIEIRGLAEPAILATRTVSPRAAGGPPAEVGVTSRGGALGSISSELKQLQKDGSKAVRERDAVAVAQALLAMDGLHRGTPGQASIIAAERARVVDSIAMVWLIDEAASPTAPMQLGMALQTFGPEVFVPLVRAIATRTSASERGTLIDIVGGIPGFEQLVTELLRTKDALLLRGAAQVAGHLRTNHAVFPLAALLRHSDEEVRTNAWHALESIGTPDAINALNAPPR